MKTAKKVLLFVIVLTIASMIVILSCKNRYTGPSKDKGVFGQSEGESGESGGELGITLPAGYLTQEEQYEPMDPDSKKQVLFTGDNYRIPALTITAKKTILAAVGTGTASSHIAIKKSSDMGQTWTDVNASYEGFSGMYTHPFFINGYDGSVLLGVATTNATENKTVIYKSVNDGQSWAKLTEISANSIKINIPNNSIVTYGQGITLRHGNNENKLLFPYYFHTNTSAAQAAKKGMFTAIMCSTDGGKTFDSVCESFILGKITNKTQIGAFTTHETKLIELSDGSILLNMRTDDDGNNAYWAKSTDCGKNWTFTTVGQTEKNNDAKHADFIRYEFNGKDIKSGAMGPKYALMVLSKNKTTAYNVRMTLNDFGGGTGNFNNKYLYNKDFATNSAKQDGYPAITVLPDGTIATLTEETNGIVFRRFNLSWLSSSEEGVAGEDYVDYETDNITK